MKKSKKSAAPVPPAVPSPSTASDAQPSAAPTWSPARYLEHKLREQNRHLPREQVLELLQRWLPEHVDKVHLAGEWIWIIFPEKPSVEVRSMLAQIGFHWNGIRKCWQHPCGAFTVRTFDLRPRRKKPRAQDDSQVKGGDQP